MTRLSSEQVLKDNNTQDLNSITVLKLTHKALYDVSCLSAFRNLERLDLTCNGLTSLEGLKSCMNLKWLSVVQNKLESLIGIEGLSKLTVLNAGKNKLKSMDEVMSLVSLRALILNDNEIVSICKLDKLKDLNTLVLSRNPVGKIGDSLVGIKSLTKLSLSNCHLEDIGSSLKSCLELKELRLAHNDIKTLPAELAFNTKLQNLDLGNNFITRLSDLNGVLNSLVNLRNLNLQGNPIAERDKSAKKICKMLPHLHVYNARPLGKISIPEAPSHTAADNLEIPVEEDHRSIRGKTSKYHVVSREKYGDIDTHARKKLEGGKQVITDKKTSKEFEVDKHDNTVGNKKHEGKSNKEPVTHEGEKQIRKRVPDAKVDGKLKRKAEIKQGEFNKKRVKHAKQKGIDKETGKDDLLVKERGRTAQKLMVEQKRSEQDELGIIDDGEASFEQLLTLDRVRKPAYVGENYKNEKVAREIDSTAGLVMYPKRKKNKNMKKGVSALQSLSTPIEVGMGGPSAWDDE